MLSTSEWSNVGGDNSFTTKTVFLPDTLEATLAASQGVGTYAISIDMSNDGDRLAVASYASNAYLFIYKRVSGIWQEETYFNEPVAQGYGYYKTSISGNGLRIAVGTEGSKIVHLYSFNGTNWVKDPVISSPSSKVQFGTCPTLTDDGNTIVVPEYSSNVAYVYNYDGSTWNLIQTLNPISGGSNLSLGFRTAISGDGSRIALTSISNFKATHIYRYDGTNYVGEATLIPDSGKDVNYGHSLDISSDGSVCVVGATASLSLYIYTRIGTTWTKNIRIDGPSSSSFSGSVSINANGNRVLVGAQTLRKAFLYQYNGTTYVPILTLTPVPDKSDYGNNVAISGDGEVLGVAARGSNNEGRVFLYN